MAIDMTSLDNLMRATFGGSYVGWESKPTDALDVLEFRFKNGSGQKHGVVSMDLNKAPAGFDIVAELLGAADRMVASLQP